MSDGRRKITSIAELEDFCEGEIKLKEIFAFNQKGLTEKGEVDGEFILYDGVPKVYKKIKARGILDIEDIFYPDKSNDIKNETQDEAQVLYYKGKYEGIGPKE